MSILKTLAISSVLSSVTGFEVVVDSGDGSDLIIPTVLGFSATSSIIGDEILSNKNESKKIIETSMIIDSMSKEQLVELEEKLNIKEHEFEVSLDEKKPKVYVKSDKNERLF